MRKMFLLRVKSITWYLYILHRTSLICSFDIFFFWGGLPSSLLDPSSPTRDGTLGPQQWKCRVLTAGLSGNFLDIFFLITFGSLTSEYNVIVLFSLGQNIRNIRWHRTLWHCQNISTSGYSPFNCWGKKQFGLLLLWIPVDLLCGCSQVISPLWVSSFFLTEWR